MSAKTGSANRKEHRKYDEAPRFDVSWHEHGPSLDYHFCREWDDDVGCYGTNPNHGMSFDAAKKTICEWHLAEAKRWGKLSFKSWAGLTP